MWLSVVICSSCGSTKTSQAASTGAIVGGLVDGWGGAATGALIYGSVTEAGLVQLASAETTITIVHTKAIPGDWFTLESDGTNWYVAGQLSVASSFTTA